MPVPLTGIATNFRTRVQPLAFNSFPGDACMITRYASGPAMIVATGVVLRVACSLVCLVGAAISVATADALPYGPPVPSPRPAGMVSHSQPELAGSYEGRAPAGDAAHRRFLLLLAADGTAVWTIVYIGKNSTAERGHWTQDGSELVLTFNPLGPNQPPGPIAFRYRRSALWPIRWNPSEWGHAGPPVLSRSRRPAAGSDAKSQL